jgi:hypothetical protein
MNKKISFFGILHVELHLAQGYSTNLIFSIKWPQALLSAVASVHVTKSGYIYISAERYDGWLTESIDKILKESDVA